jgi:hypothetical protein
MTHHQLEALAYSWGWAGIACVLAFFFGLALVLL